MTDDAAHRPQPASTERLPAGEPPRSQPQKTSWALPLIALVIGLALGALGMYLARSGSSTAAPAPSPTTVTVSQSATTPATSTTTATGPATAVTGVATVPAVCLKLADEAQGMRTVSSQAAQAAQALDAKALSEAVRLLGEAQDRLSRTADQCRAQGVSASTTR